MTNRLISILLLSALPLCASAQPAYPVVGKAEQKARDDDRRAILQDELATERAALAKAQAALDAGATPERAAGVHRHAENVKALLRELDGSSGRRGAAEPVRAVARATRPAASTNTASARNPARFWDPYNRTPDTTDFSTTPRGDSHEQ